MANTAKSRSDLLAEIRELKSENDSLVEQNEDLLDRLDQISTLTAEIQDEAEAEEEDSDSDDDD